ncbi:MULTISPECIES: hypothetical protein [unclassified Microcoleus]|uniref:hypothetical protein n=1 Tax=unclassified Microcoleus TaxID=2642155 RepID=UPI002FD5B97F
MRGEHREAFRYTIADGDARVLIYFTCFFLHLTCIAPVLNPCHVKCDRYIQQALFNMVYDRTIILPIQDGDV